MQCFLSFPERHGHCPSWEHVIPRTFRKRLSYFVERLFFFQLYSLLLGFAHCDKPPGESEPGIHRAPSTVPFRTHFLYLGEHSFHQCVYKITANPGNFSNLRKPTPECFIFEIPRENSRKNT